MKKNHKQLLSTINSYSPKGCPPTDYRVDVITTQRQLPKIQSEIHARHSVEEFSRDIEHKTRRKILLGMKPKALLLLTETLQDA